MRPTQDKYPVFEANQVLTNAHLNETFNYLDEQERLTRANLIGIGIVCGLEIRLDAAATTTIYLSKGCGVTSEGHLIVEPEDLALVAYRADYKAPDELDYRPFKDPSSNVQYSLWELFAAGEPDTTPLSAVPNFLNDKAVLLFLELTKAGLRNCSPNNCDDKGAAVTAAVRRLLIKVDDLTKIITAANQLGTGLTFTDLETALLARLKLPDLRLPRYDVPNTSPVTSNQVLAAFHAVFHTDQPAHNTGNALIAAYEAFKPLVQDVSPTNPFANFNTTFGFLDNTPITTTQVGFLQYYYDFFDDLLRAYEEFRWKGVELMCTCCPPEGLFPRHLMLGVLFPASVNSPGVYRHQFLASSAIGGCEERTKELKQLFQRIVEMIASFTNTPTLPQPSSNSKTDTQIRITPSTLGDAPLSDKAIPYYYLQNGAPALFQLWSAEKTRRNRANQNLSYRSDEYTPTAPAFVTDALRYDLEPYNCLRIEGHLGKDYQSVLNTLLSLKNRYRLPIEIIALRTGAFDDNVPVDLSKEDCRFQDLETLYDTLKAELSCFLCKEVQYVYDLPYEVNSEITTPVKPNFPLLAQCAPDFLVQPQTIGRFFEDLFSTLPGGVIPDIDPTFLIDSLSRQNVNQIVFYIIIYISKLFDEASQDLGQFNFVNFEKRFLDLVSVTEAIEREREKGTGNLDGSTNLLNWEELDDRLEAIIYNCRLDAFRALQEEYKRRIRQVKQNGFLGYFLRNNPGIQHKAGVPLGGTFIIVYHDEPVRLAPGLNLDEIRPITLSTRQTFGTTKINTAAIADAFARISSNRRLAIDPDIRLVLGTFTGQAPDLGVVAPASEEADKIIEQAVNAFDNGTVIADFYLPYLCCSDCSPVQFVLPKTPPQFSVQIGCTNTDRQAEVTVTPKGGLAPYTYQLDAQPFQALTGKLVLAVGSYTLVIGDSAGAESAPRSLTVPEPLSIGTETFIDDVSAKTYQVSFDISGGTPPYKAESRGPVRSPPTSPPGSFTLTPTGSRYTSDSIKSAESIQVRIADSIGCEVSKEFKHTVCDLPCSGIAVRRGYVFILPTSNFFGSFSFEFPQGGMIDLSTEVNTILQEVAGDTDSFAKRLNLLIAEQTGRSDWLKFDHSPSQSGSMSMDTWDIEYFECLQFKFAVTGPLFLTSALPVTTITVTPSASAIVVRMGEVIIRSVTIPAFDGVKIDKCNPQTPVETLCVKAPDLTLEISKQVVGNTVSLEVTATGNDEPAAYLWEVQDGIPAMSNGQKADFQFVAIEPTTKKIRVTAYTKTGCRVIAEDTIDLRTE